MDALDLILHDFPIIITDVIEDGRIQHQTIHTLLNPATNFDNRKFH